MKKFGKVFGFFFGVCIFSPIFATTPAVDDRLQDFYVISSAPAEVSIDDVKDEEPAEVEDQEEDQPIDGILADLLSFFASRGEVEAT